MRLAYLGSPEAAVPPLQALVHAGFEIPIVVSRADKRRARGSRLMPSPVKAAAIELGIPVSSKVDDVLDAGVDLGVVVAFGRLIKLHVLDQVPMVNLHFSLLPRWRGAAPVERAILAGDTETGVCLMQLEVGLDTGPVYAVERVPIAEHETAEELRARLVAVGAPLLTRLLTAGLPDPVAQVGEPTYAEKINPAEMRIDWSRPVTELDRLIRLERAWTMFRSHRLRILRARPTPGRSDHPGEESSRLDPGALDGSLVGTGTDGINIELEVVQPEGKAPQPASAWLNGARLQAGERLE